jgi:hypothetical protein
MENAPFVKVRVFFDADKQEASMPKEIWFKPHGGVQLENFEWGGYAKYVLASPTPPEQPSAEVADNFSLALKISETVFDEIKHSQGCVASMERYGVAKKVEANIQAATRSSNTEADALVKALEAFIGSAYPVSDKNNSRKQDWSESDLDRALVIAMDAIAAHRKQRGEG